MGDTRRSQPRPPLVGTPSPVELAAYRDLRHRTFVDQQGIFCGSDLDEVDSDPRTVILVVRDQGGQVVGGVRVAPVGSGDLGWWRGSRLVVDPRAHGDHAGSALVRAACALAESLGALRFDATVQRDKELFFRHLGWVSVGEATVEGRDHVLMRWPVTRIADVTSTKSAIGPVLAGLRPGGVGFVGDDAAPVSGSSLVAACDAIVPALVEREPTWAGWCAILVNANDVAAMGATPVAALDAVAGRNVAHVRRVVEGLSAASAAFGVPIIGGHTQIGVPASLAVTMMGQVEDPIAGGGGRIGDEVRLTADLGGSWRPGHLGQQWDSTSGRTSAELEAMLSWVRRARPHAAKDVSMAGLVGTLGMLAEASGCGAELDVDAIPVPTGASLADWVTCFPGFAMLTAHAAGAPVPPSAPAVSATCGRLVAGRGVTLVWPDGTKVRALDGPVTGLGAA